jgi:transcription elongation factor Elf1
MNNNRLQILYQKTDFNHHQICQLSGIFKCSKCKKNNSVMIDKSLTVQLCLFCGMPNQVKKNIEEIKNIK